MDAPVLYTCSLVQTYLDETIVHAVRVPISADKHNEPAQRAPVPAPINEIDPVGLRTLLRRGPGLA